MKIHRFIGSFLLRAGKLDIIDKEIVSQINKVLKLKIGEFIELSDGKNLNAKAIIKKIDKNNISVEIEKTWETKDQIKNNVTLYCAILKKENFETVVQKTTECGVSKIIPIITNRTIKTGLNIERLQKIAKEASEQSGRSNVPEVSEPITFEESTKLADKNNTSILFDGNGELFYEMLSKTQQNQTENSSTRTYNIYIGPEGGWTEKEITEVKKLNFKIASLGPLTLRGETAAIISTYLAVNL